MDIQLVLNLVTIIVSYVCGLIAKKHPKFNNKLIPVQNSIIGIIMMLINWIITKDFNASILLSGLTAGGIYDLKKNAQTLIDLWKKGE